MYYPYFRGKQYELVTIRENAKLIAESDFIPIIEPVKDNLSPLERALAALKENSAKAIIVINPKYGSFKNNNLPLLEFLAKKYADYPEFGLGIKLSADTPLDQIRVMIEQCLPKKIYLIHDGFNEPVQLKNNIDLSPVTKHIFVKETCSDLYIRHYSSQSRVLLDDGFFKKNNRQYDYIEHFSDLHILYSEKYQGFGDFLIVGDDYTEIGGPAWTVAIHLTFIDPKKENDMFVFHFKSDTQDTPTDPGKKFAEALEKLVAEYKKPDTPLLHTKAVTELLQLHRDGHFPGLGYVKKLSMQHHLELMADYFQKNRD